MPAVAERLMRAYPAPPERAGVGSIPANPDAQNVPSFRRWRFEMKLSPFYYCQNSNNIVWVTSAHESGTCGQILCLTNFNLRKFIDTNYISRPIPGTIPMPMN
jgi:hypothetical protein